MSDWPLRAIKNCEDHAPQWHMGVKIALERGDEGRAGRLISFLDTANQIGAMSRHNRVIQKISHVLDHEGNLAVLWHSEPTESEKAILLLAWNGEGEWQVDHAVVQ